MFGTCLLSKLLFRYPGCTTRTSVPSQPTALQKPSYKKEPYLQNKNTTTTTAAAQPNTQTQHHHHAQPNTPTPKPNPTQPREEKKFQLAKAVKINYKINNINILLDFDCKFLKSLSKYKKINK